MFDKKNRTWHDPAIKEVAQLRGFYDSDVESALNDKVEKPANPVIEKLIEGSAPTHSERLALSKYLGTMMRRVPYRRELGIKRAPRVVESTVDGIRAHFREALASGEHDPAVIHRRLKEIDALSEGWKLKTPESIIKLLRLPWPTVKEVDLFNRMTWRVLEAVDSSGFLTCDNPLFFFRGLWSGQYRSRGVLSPFATKSFALLLARR